MQTGDKPVVTPRQSTKDQNSESNTAVHTNQGSASRLGTLSPVPASAEESTDPLCAGRPGANRNDDDSFIQDDEFEQQPTPGFYIFNDITAFLSFC